MVKALQNLNLIINGVMKEVNKVMVKTLQNLNLIINEVVNEIIN